jgi:hypothetical protein
MFMLVNALRVAIRLVNHIPITEYETQENKTLPETLNAKKQVAASSG